MPLGVKMMDGTCRCTKWHWEHRVLLSLIGIAGTYVRQDSESTSTSLSASLISFKRQSSSCRVIWAKILASYANMLKWKGALSPFEGSFFNDLSNRTSIWFFLSSSPNSAEAWTGTCSQHCWLLCLICSPVVLSQALSSRSGAYWLRDSGLRR